jgi:hypothetical protein
LVQQRGRNWLVENIFQLAPTQSTPMFWTVLDSSTSSALQQLQQHAQQFGISNLATLLGQLELARAYLCAIDVANSNSSSSSNCCQNQLAGGSRAFVLQASAQA